MSFGGVTIWGLSGEIERRTPNWEWFALRSGVQHLDSDDDDLIEELAQISTQKDLEAKFEQYTEITDTYVDNNEEVASVVENHLERGHQRVEQSSGVPTIVARVRDLCTNLDNYNQDEYNRERQEIYSLAAERYNPSSALELADLLGKWHSEPRELMESKREEFEQILYENSSLEPNATKKLKEEKKEDLEERWKNPPKCQVRWTRQGYLAEAFRETVEAEKHHLAGYNWEVNEGSYKEAVSKVTYITASAILDLVLEKIEN